jgi:hypothetical protein
MNALTDALGHEGIAMPAVIVEGVHRRPPVIRRRAAAGGWPGRRARRRAASPPCPSNPLGIKGCGEAGAIAAPAAVMNALTDALGHEDREGRKILGARHAVIHEARGHELAVGIVDRALVESNPLGIKGCGEAGAIAAPAAVMNALTDALGHEGLGARHAVIHEARGHELAVGIVDRALVERLPDPLRDAATSVSWRSIPRPGTSPSRGSPRSTISARSSTR